MVTMSKIESIKGVVKTFFWLTKEELDSMDHKLARIAFGVIGFATAAMVWYFIFSRFSLF